MPVLTAVTSSARQLHQLLRCIAFSPKATVQLTPEGLRFSVDDARAVQALAFLDKALFTTYTYIPPQNPHAAASSQSSSTSDPDADSPTFQISLPALLETLSIFGTADTAKDRPGPFRDNSYASGIQGSYAIGSTTAFDNRTLGLASLCRIQYLEHAGTLRIALDEAGVKTTCSLTTYEPDDPSSTPDIPFDRASLTLKVIMRASHLHDAVAELASLSPSTLHITASPATASKPANLTLSATGALGSASIHFAADSASSSKSTAPPPSEQLLETFQCAETSHQTYSFPMIKHAMRAMALASKVSIRGDLQGVLSLQFMIEVETGGVSFVDFRFVPFMRDEDATDSYSESADESDRDENGNGAESE